MRSHSCVSKNCNDMGRTACSLPALPREKASFCATKEGVQLRKVYSWQCPATPMWKGPPSTPRGDQTSFLKAMWVPWAPHGPAVSASFSSPFHRCREIKKKKWLGMYENGDAFGWSPSCFLPCSFRNQFKPKSVEICCLVQPNPMHLYTFPVKDRLPSRVYVCICHQLWPLQRTEGKTST